MRFLIQEATGETAGLPPLKTLIQREEADPDSSDDEIEMQEGAQSFKDPILMTWLVQPVKKCVSLTAPADKEPISADPETCLAPPARSVNTSSRAARLHR